MSNKMNKLVLLSALMIAIIGTFGTVSAEQVDLIAGNGSGEGIDVGDVTVTNNATHIVVEFTTTDNWYMTETHLHVVPVDIDGVPLDDIIPLTKKNNPIPGKFEHFTDDQCTKEVKYIITLPAGTDSVIIAAHAAVELLEVDEESGEPVVDDETGETVMLDEETAWGEGVEFNDDRNWAMYFTYTI